MINRLKGLGVAVITPFLQNGEIDFLSLEKITADLIQNKVDYLVALGTTSESPTLSDEEKKNVVKTIVKVTNAKVPVVMGLGGPSTHDVVHKMTHDDFTGVDAILSVTPYYNRPSQEGLYEHFKELSYFSPLPIIMYNIFSRTSCNLEPETTLRIANDFDKIIGVKEASGNMNQIMKLIKHKPDNFLVISGDDAVTLPLLAAGIDGVISVVANAFPHKMADMVHLAFENRFAEALTHHLDLLDITQACFKEGSPAGIKAVMAIQGKIDYYLRLPLTRVSQSLQMEIKELVADF
jgi:4-hydroxy-tetrahydrodipicolinate synthase